MGALHANGQTFEAEVLKADKPVLVDFWAEWCGPCKMISPMIDEVSEELKEKAKVVKVNIDDAQDLATKYGVMSIPTLLIFKNGDIVEQFVGAMSKEQLISKINTHVG